jgi:transcriptional activator cubitus interruptus
MEIRIIILCLLQVNFVLFLGARRGINLSDLPMHFTDLKVEGSKSNATVAQTQLIDLQLKLAPGQTNAQKQMQQQATLRRDSNSTVSTYYGSMCSGELGSSRRSSQASQVFASFPYNLKI